MESEKQKEREQIKKELKEALEQSRSDGKIVLANMGTISRVRL